MTHTPPARIPYIPVIAAPVFDPDTNQMAIRIAAGATLLEIATQVLPAPLHSYPHLRLIVMAPDGRQSVIDQNLWSHCRPKPGVTVIIRVVPGKDALRAVLSIAIMVAAVALGQFGPLLAGTLGIGGAGWTALITLGVNVVGSLLANALIPPPETEEDAPNRYQIFGWRNRLDPDGAIPVVLGQIRVAPPFAAIGWSEIVGDWQYIRALFTFGYGQLSLSDFRIGDTPLSDYDEVDIEVRDGIAGDDPVTLFPTQVLEEEVKAELSRPRPRDDSGEVISGQASEDNPVTRATARDAAQASVILFCSAGLFTYDDKQRRLGKQVNLKIEQRHVSAESWETVIDLEIYENKRAAFFRQYTWDLPYRGRWQIRVTRISEESTDAVTSDTLHWAALQSIRPEYPLAFTAAPLTLVAVRVKATHQLNRALDNFSALAARICPDYDHELGQWVSRETSNPAALYIYALQSPANPRPATDAQIDWAGIEAWHDFCRINGLKYDRVLDETTSSLRDVLLEITAAGRASPRHDGLKWGVTVDQPMDLIVDEISPRNSRDFKAARSYVEPPHAFRVKFKDATADYEPAERLVTRPGYEGDVILTEVLTLPGKTDPDEVWIEATRRWLEIEHRPDMYQVTQDGAVRTATRGDLVRLSHDVLSHVQRAARVTRVEGALIELDQEVTVEDGVDYALRFRTISEADTIGTSDVIRVTGQAGTTAVVRAVETGLMPPVGTPVFFGVLDEETLPMIVKAVEAGEDNTQILHLIDAAPEIDERLSGMDIPAWSGRVGDEIALDVATPSAPRFTQVSSGLSGTGTANQITYLLVPASDAISPASFVIEHRLLGGGTTSLTIPVAQGGGTLDTYVTGNTVEIRAQTVAAGIGGTWTEWVTCVVGLGDASIPDALPADPVVTQAPGHLDIGFDTGPDSATEQVQVYLSDTGIVDRDTDAFEDAFAVQASRAIAHVIGDATRTNLVSDTWTPGTGWSGSPGNYTHSPGTASSLSQPATLTVGKVVRFAIEVTGATAGTVQARLTGGSDRLGSSQSGNGTLLDRIEAVTGNDTVLIRASTDFDGTIGAVIVFEETDTCLDQGTAFLWLEPQNEDGVPGPMSGPVELSVW